MFYGPDGLYRYKQLNYGTKSSQDIMQIEMQKVLSRIPNQVNISDDILTGANTVEAHDKTLERVLGRLKEYGLTVKLNKCVFDVEEIPFLELIFRKEGISPSERNTTNLKEAPQPSNTSELRSFLGMATYSERFIPRFADIVFPLRQLLKQKKWTWQDEHQMAFENVKEALSKDALLHHYVIGRETEVIVDMSDSGLGAVLVQRESKKTPFQPVIYKSRTLKDTERRYSATEREALAIQWAVKKLRQYLVGAPKFKIVTDHRPLRYMFHKLCGDTPPRIERFIMDIQEFDYEVEFRPGKTCIADYLSRHPVPRQGSSEAKTVEGYV